MRMKTTAAVILLVCCVICACRDGGGRNENARPVRIGVISIVEHPFLEQARQGFVDEMTRQGYVSDKNVKYDYRNAFGKVENANSIAAAFVGNKVDLIYSIATPTTKAVKERTTTIPIVFAAVTDPVGASLVNALEKPGGNVTGVSDRIPVRYQLEVIKAILPSIRRLGVPYNAGEPNSASLVGEMKKIGPELGITIVEATAATTADVAQAVSSLVGNADAVYMPTDNTMAAAVNVISDICIKNQKPFFSAEDETIKKDGALASLSVDHYKLGAEAAKMAARILKGEAKPGDIPVGGLREYDLTINLRVARTLKLEIPDAVKAKAKLIQ